MTEILLLNKQPRKVTGTQLTCTISVHFIHGTVEYDDEVEYYLTNVKPDCGGMCGSPETPGDSIPPLCDGCWLEEYVKCVGMHEAIVGGIEKYLPIQVSGMLHVRGQMVSEVFSSIEGTDYDEYFEVEDWQFEEEPNELA